MNTNPQYSSDMEGITRLMRDGQNQAAIDQLREVLRQSPDDIKALHMLGVCQRRAGLLDQAIQIQQSILERSPDFAGARQELGLNLKHAGKVTEAIEAFRQATELDPRLVISWKMLGDLSMRVGNEEDAVHAYSQYPAPQDKDPLFGRALEVFEENQVRLAEFLFRKYQARQPDDENAPYYLAQIALKVGAVSDALVLLEKTLQLSPDFQQARFQYIGLLSRRQRYSEALAEMDKLLEADPGKQEVQLLHAALLDRTGQYEQAIAIMNGLIKDDPEQVTLWTGLGFLQRTVGRGEEAAQSFSEAVNRDPGRGEPWFALANLKNHVFTDAQIEAMQKSLERSGDHPGDQVYFSFALGKAMEDRGNYGQAFDYYARGNEIKSRSASFDPAANRAMVSALKSTFLPTLSEQFSSAGCADPAPIFIVGLPRSGSTLVEQILASHSLVDGTQELANISTIIKELNYSRRKQKLSAYPQCLADLDESALTGMGEKYLADTKIHRGSAPFFIDKMPNNFEHIGLISLVLPGARIIDVRRDPMANGFSAFKQLFNVGQDWSYKLEDIAHYYRGYIELMNHWDEVLPGKVHHVQYESLVEDTENQVRKMLEFLGLAYEASCVDFHLNPRPVRTASSEQVRQPIHSSALQHWKNFEAQMEPFKNTLNQ